MYYSDKGKTNWIYISVILLTLSSCKLGPNFQSPPSPSTAHYIQGQNNPRKTESNKGTKLAGVGQTFHLGQDIPADWWRVFHSSKINCLIDVGFKNNPNLMAAKAALIQAHENYLTQIGSLFPAVVGNFSAERQRFSFTEFGGSSTGPVGTTVFNLFNTNISVAYTLDVFGGIRRQIEAAGAMVDYQQFEFRAAFVTLSSNIVVTAITIGSLRAQISATSKLISAQEETLSLVKKQFVLGGVSRADVLTQENQLAQARATLPPLKQNLAQNLHTLSILIGKFPSEKELPDFSLDTLFLPTDLPLSCPSCLTRQRPDVRAAEALLHSASAQIGVATANLFPQITINGDYGQQNTSLAGLFLPPNNIWYLSGAIAQPIFKGGALIAQRRAAIAAYKQAAAQYKQTVLQAFKNVADTLRALEHDAQLLKEQTDAEIAARNSLTLLRQQFQLGGVSYLALLTAERTYQQALISQIQAQTARYVDTATLFQALGGGWWEHGGDLCKKE